MRGDRVEIVIDAGDGVRAYDVVATRAGRRVEITQGRTVVEVTAQGRRKVADWLAEPVAHVRDARSELAAVLEETYEWLSAETPSPADARMPN